MTEVMSLTEAAEFLQLHFETVIKYWRAGQIPGRKVGRQYRFLRSDLLSWVSNGHIT